MKAKFLLPLLLFSLFFAACSNNSEREAATITVPTNQTQASNTTEITTPSVGPSQLMESSTVATENSLGPLASFEAIPSTTATPTTTTPSTTATPSTTPTPTTVRYIGGKPAVPGESGQLSESSAPPKPCLESNTRAYYTGEKKAATSENRVVRQLFYDCLIRPEVIYDDNIWVKKLREGVPFEEVRSGINNSLEARCLRGSYDCAAVRIERDFNCNFSTAVVQYERQKERLNGLCPEVSITVE